jgi:alkylation response protein AidB-like acyl-CoA dehydrogenase
VSANGAAVDFDFSPEQEMLRASVRALLSDKAPISYVRDAYENPQHHEAFGADHVWAGLRELGVLGLLVPEEHGGTGMGMVDAAVVLEELGRALSPSPYASSAIGAASLVTELGSDGAKAALLPGLADGSHVGTLAIYEAGDGYEWRRPSTTARPTGDGWWVLSGSKVHVADAPSADLFLVTARDPDDGLGVFAVQNEIGGETPTVDITRYEGPVDVDSVHARRLGEGDATAAVAHTLDRLGVAYAVDGVGAAQRALELAVEYAKERVQFGKPIGSFQAVQHLCADMLRAVELGRAAAYYACWADDDADASEAHRAAVMAKAFVADQFPAVGATAIQVFGGVGFTWEHDIHLLYKRLLTAAVALGSADTYLAELANLAIG